MSRVAWGVCRPASPDLAFSFASSSQSDVSLTPCPLLQGAFLPRPSVIPGKKTRAVRDSEVPEVGTFTRDNAWVSTSPTKVRERLARTLDKQLPGEELPILHPTELRAWWAARIAGRLPTNPMGVEEVRESQLAWAKKRHGKRERVRGIKVSLAQFS